MPQNADLIKDHIPLFREPEYTEMFARKRECFENSHGEAKVAEVAEWTKSWDYREKNLAREALVINPNKACQPLGALFAAAGFDGTLGYVHGSQGCAAYFRSHLSRHFKEASSVVSDSMTEDAAVFGGLNNMVDGLANAYALYKPKMIAVCTSCMAEVIGDDISSFIGNAKTKESIPADFPVPFAHTPSFVGSHIVGYDNMMKGILTTFWDGKVRDAATDKINIIPGFDGYSVGNIRELKRILGMIGVEYTVLSDTSDVYDTPTDGEFRMYDGGTTQDDTIAALQAKATLSLSEYCTPATLKFIAETGQETAAFNYPMGVGATDDFLVKLVALTGKDIPEELTKERGRLVDALADSMTWLHGKKMAVYGDPDFTLSMVRFLLEMGVEPVHVLATNGTKKWEKQVKALLATSPFGKDAQVWQGKDLWHLRSLLATEPADFLIGNSYGKYLELDLGIPLIRLTFPIFDRHHHHRFPTMFYDGSLRVLTTILDKVFDTLDRESGENGISFDLTR
ncbi:nitrogenase molybdenum-iron protein subunit beta [Rhodospirillum rubrum]|nr:nitrogenase molybdenum-iron protein subunit beta [Rhodospirillum rubrum]MBK1664695.1 nitrogenase molybdenum-iron protein subunit beta [Rhodospirillum rubrum]MBK1676549.1 nitrogenase molybdenum-iron protein subunit beta [Rhodospirillum rubrum]